MADIDERIEKLTASQERQKIDLDKMQVIMAATLESIQRLERIALAHEVRLEDVEKTLAMLEQRKPQ